MIRRRARALTAGLGVVLILVGIASLCIGRYPVALTTVVRILIGMITGTTHSATPLWSDTELVVVATVRLPRVIVAALAGAGLGLSGAVLQGVFRNPLVGPQTLGISNGAAWGGVVAILLGLGGLGTVGLAFGFALLSLAAVFTLDRLAGMRTTLSVVLAGVIVGSFSTALVGLAEFLADPQRQLPGIVYWLLGSFATTTSSSVAIVAPPIILGGLGLLALRWRVNVLSLGDADATALGVNVNALRWSILSLVTLIVAAQVAVSGAIGWVGLVVPHLARRLVGPNHQDLLPASAIVGAIALLGVDDVARTLAAQEIPIGVLTALLGTPVFALVFWRSRSLGWARE